MPTSRAAMFTIFSLLALAIMSVSGLQVPGAAMVVRTESCGLPGASCDTCGADFKACGPSTCFNPSIGETCCSPDAVCPAGTTCGADPGHCMTGYTTLFASTITTTGTRTTTSTLYLTSGGSAPAPYGPLPPSSTPVVEPSMPAPNPPNTTAPAAEPSVTPAPSSTTCNLETATTPAANNTIPAVSSTSTHPGHSGLSVEGTSTTVVTPVSTATRPAVTTSIASPTSAASTAYANPGLWTLLAFVAMMLAVFIHQT